MEYGSVTAVVGHDFGSPVAAHCALIRPDIFTSVVMMSAPFAGPPPAGPAPEVGEDVYAALGRLTPPRQHYQQYYSTRRAAADMLGPPQGLHDFLRAYFHVKSGDWPGNKPYPLNAFNPGELASLPGYYVMPAGARCTPAVGCTCPRRRKPRRPVAD
jgi:pimeloyl-ACP methyl ester carboxylesterase